MYFRPEIVINSQLLSNLKNLTTNHEITALDLSEFSLGWDSYEQRFNIEEIYGVIDAIPTHITHLKLGGNFANLATEQFHTLLIRLHSHQHLKSLDLGASHLGKRTPKELQYLFSALSRTLEELILRNNFLDWSNAEDYSSAFQSLPNLISLDLSGHNITTLNKGFSFILKALPKSLKQLILQENFQNDFSEYFQSNITSLPQQLESLDISGFQLNAIPRFPLSLRILYAYNLSEQAIDPMLFKTFLGGLPRGLTHLYLSLNNFKNYSPENILQIMSSTPPALTHLTIESTGSNQLMSVSNAVIKSIVQYIPKNVTCFAMNTGSVNHNTCLQLMPPNVKIVILDGCYYPDYPERLLVQVQNTIKNRSNLTADLTSIQLSSGISDANVNDMIKQWRHSANPLHLLTCGLLTQGLIKQMNSAQNNAFFVEEQRLHNALDYYFSLVDNQKYKIVVQTLLLDIKKNYACDSIQNRINNARCLPNQYQPATLVYNQAPLKWMSKNSLQLPKIETPNEHPSTTSQLY